MKDIKYVIGILLLMVLILPVIINITLFLPFPSTPSDLGNSEWLSFWGSYIGGAIGGIGTLLAVYFTIRYYEVQNERNINLIRNSDIVAKISIILEKIADRETIPNSCYSYTKAFTEIKEMIEQYNQLQGYLISYFTNRAIGIFISLLYVIDENSEEMQNNLLNYFKIPDDVKEYAFIVGRLALYENCAELIRGNAQIGHIIEKEVGGSYGMWHYFLHEIIEDEYIEKSLKDFFALVPKLAYQLEEMKSNMNTIL
ncbi:hypothetical protein [Alkaliphilus hydrothermalis]|uniref:Phage abortive infection protein n=1 Tax=Alkaliphilus hydrothermalis TaxID=1482730 RepID=A0ABS2NLP1_9FIRM|nr:hypothetical protein [Alkaliphilus hydrothermalis]MBM7613848.1 hypothetical protein [Alkaliphilus hydrothermalis]